VNTFRRLLHPWGLLLFLALSLTACTGQTERVSLNAPGWNRARLVGNTPIVDPVSIALDDAGGIYLFLFGGDGDAYYPRVIALDRRAEVVWDRTYDQIALNRPDQSQIIWDGQTLQLIWLSDQGLYNTKITAATGELLAPPALLSGNVKVANYSVARDTDGSQTFWYAGPQKSPGLYALPPGEPAGEPTLVDPAGIIPDLRYDSAGTLHATWTRYPPGENHPQFIYGAYQDGLYVAGQERIMLDPRVGTTRVYGPWLGIDRQRVYLIWTIVPRIGPLAGMAATSYIHFPLGQPASASPVRQVSIPYSYHLSYQTPPEGGLESGPRVLSGGGNTYIARLAVDPALSPELAMAFHTKLEYLRRQEQGQVSTIFLQDGIPNGYQQISFTPASSDYPAVLSDKAGQLYITWMEGSALSGYDVYFSSTAPDIRGALSGLTWGEFGPLAAETLFGLLTGAVLVPLALLWILPAMVILGLTSVIRRDDESFSSPGVIVSLALAITAYWVTKLAFMPTVRDYVPFSAWLPFLPPALNLPLQVGVPLLITGLALAVAGRYTYGGERPSPFFFLLIYAVVDGALTMAVYGVTFYGAF
jgi:hypothetical protein